MKRVTGLICVFLFVMLIGNVLAMTELVSVKTAPGDWVKIYVRPTGSAQILNLGNGTADENGTFSYTFFSLNVPSVYFTVFVIRDGEKIRDVDFSGHDINEALNIDCTGSGCKVVDTLIEEVVEVVVVEEEVVVENETIETEVIEEGKYKSVLLTGKAIFIGEDGSVNWRSSAGGASFVFLFFVFVLMMVHHNNKKETLDEDDKELVYMEKKAKETEDKIKDIRGHDAKKKKLEEAKERLAADEKELGELEKEKVEVNSGEVQVEIEKKEEAVEKDEEAVEKREDVIEKNEAVAEKKEEMPEGDEAIVENKERSAEEAEQAV